MRIFRLLIGVLCLWLPAVSQADLYQWTDADGVIHIVDETSEVPETYRAGMKVYRAAKPSTGVLSLPVSPSRTYAAQSQGAFAQKIALDLGLIKESSEDAFGPLRGAGVQPASGWEASDPLTPEVVDDVLAAARRAATDYGDIPFIFGFPGGHHHHGNHPDDNRGSPSPPLSGPFTPNPAGVSGSPTHLPFGASHLPFGTTHLPFGSSRAR